MKIPKIQGRRIHLLEQPQRGCCRALSRATVRTACWERKPPPTLPLQCLCWQSPKLVVGGRTGGRSCTCDVMPLVPLQAGVTSQRTFQQNRSPGRACLLVSTTVRWRKPCGQNQQKRVNGGRGRGKEVALPVPHPYPSRRSMWSNSVYPEVQSDQFSSGSPFFLTEAVPYLSSPGLWQMPRTLMLCLAKTGFLGFLSRP